MAALARSDSDAITVHIDARLYPERVIYKCFYWYGGAYEVTIELAGKDQFAVKLRSHTGPLSELKQEALLGRIRQDLVDFKTRDIISQETKAVRELLIAKAFANHDAFDEAPVGEIADPLGFAPKAFEENREPHV